MKKNALFFVTGHKGMVGSAVIRRLNLAGFNNIITADRKEADLTNQQQVDNFIGQHKPDYVILTAAKVGGIKANMTYPAQFLYENMMIQNNVIHFSHMHQVKKLCFLGSSCIYPKNCPQPMKEEYLMDGKLEPTNEGYALAKIAGLKLVEYYQKQYGFHSVAPMPCNLYGTNDNFHPDYSHVLSSLVRKFVDAVTTQSDTVEVWGTGIARREFMHVDDLADAIIFLMENFDSPEVVNVGWGNDLSIKELAEMIGSLAGFKGSLFFDSSKPDGMLKKCLDISRISDLGFSPKITLEEGITQTIQEYKQIQKHHSIMRSNPL